KAYEGLFGKHYEVLRGIKDEAKFQAALAASLDALKGKPGKVAAAQDDPLSFLGDESAATEPPEGPDDGRGSRGIRPARPGARIAR
ncbi:MAG: hypothetical protein V1790_01880, partial [Planctomycetota bacterium]